ncbi:hypothetical protein B0H19DRAFT_1268400 [Mycena capillaripes]|nr:hypothetical protein B0H19DRAFT_1268400 [Mycena capillaripes]
MVRVDAKLSRIAQKTIPNRHLAHLACLTPKPYEQTCRGYALCVNFPAAWLIPAGDNRIMRTHLFGVELVGLVVQFYFGITGCIIPVGGFLDWHEDVVGFKLAGPCDFDGRKEFYMFCYSPALCETRLARYDCGFANVADFQQNLPATKHTSVEPVTGGKETLERLGIPIPPY